MKNQKGQILLVVFMLLLFSSIILGGVVMLWQSSLNTSGLQKYSLAAFYLAQSGIERACAEIMYKAATEPTGPNGIDNWLDGGQSFFEPNLAGGSYLVDITMGTGADKNMVKIVSMGKMGNSERKIQLKILVNEVSCSRVGKSGRCGPPWGNAWGYWSRFDNEWEEQ